MSDAPKTPHIEATAFEFLRYTSRSRWLSYYQQVTEVLAVRPGSLLIIGNGDGVIATLLRHLLPGTTIKTFDFHPGLHPDILGDIRDIRRLLGPEKFDCILCCQVLEHLPFSDFEPIVRDLAQCVTKRLILSLPYHSLRFALTVDFWKFQPRRVFFQIPKFWKRTWTYDGHHYWEIDSPNCPRKNVEKAVKKYFHVLRQFQVRFFEFHCFFILEPLAAPAPVSKHGP